MDESLRIDWHVGRESAGDNPLGPEKAYFYWKRGNEERAEHVREFTRSELEAEIAALEKQKQAVPVEYRAALSRMGR
jgi:hypothetical protein